MLRDKEELDSVAVASKRTTTNLVRVQKKNKQKKRNRMKDVWPLCRWSSSPERERERGAELFFFFFAPLLSSYGKQKMNKQANKKENSTNRLCC